MPRRLFLLLRSVCRFYFSFFSPQTGSFIRQFLDLREGQWLPKLMGNRKNKTLPWDAKHCWGHWDRKPRRIPTRQNWIEFQLANSERFLFFVINIRARTRESLFWEFKVRIQCRVDAKRTWQSVTQEELSRKSFYASQLCQFRSDARWFAFDQN